jgi:hypothetical protein
MINDAKEELELHAERPVELRSCRAGAVIKLDGIAAEDLGDLAAANTLRHRGQV